MRSSLKYNKRRLPRRYTPRNDNVTSWTSKRKFYCKNKINLNKMKTLIKLLFLTLVVLLTANLAISAPVSVEKAKTVAFNFIKNVDSRLTSDAMSMLYSKTDAYYVFGNECAWVIVSANDAVAPILAYSTENSFVIPQNEADTTIGNNFWGWIKAIEKQIRFVAENNIYATEEIQNQWISMSAGNNKSPTTVVPPLLTTTWGQGWPYNAYCPDVTGGPGGKAWAGCVATAMAQILHYNYSNQTSFQGVGSYSYQRPGWPVTSANFGATTYNMAIMPNEVNDISETGASQIATLTYHAAVGCKSIWGAASTGVMFSTNGGSYVLGDYPFLGLIQNYLPMAASSRFVIKSQYTDAEWHSLIQTELLENRPVYYRGDGSLSHAWVCDGVDNSNMYHFNWGWDGDYNGYFVLSNINPGANNLTNNQMAMIGLAPNDGSTLTANTTWSGTMNINNINVPDAVTLTINPGTIINFSPNSSMRVWGKIASIGTATNYVKLTASNQTDGWGGIDFHEDYLDRMADNDTSRFVYTQIEYSKSSGLYVYDYGKLVVDHCKINDNDGFNGAGIYVNHNSIKISNSEVYNNHATNGGGGLYLGFTDNVAMNVCNNDIHDNIAVVGGGFYLYALNNMSFENNIIRLNQAGNGAGGTLGGGSPRLINNKFVNNTTPSPGFGCLYLENCNAKIVNNLIANNSANGIRCENSNPQIISNTIVSNNHDAGSGIIFVNNSDAVVKNCIIYDNVSNMSGSGNQISIADNDSDPYFYHCDIEGGLSGFGGPGSGTNYSSANYTNNIDSDPVFVSPSAGAGSGYNGLTADWSLQSSSVCINAGDTTTISQYLPILDLAGNPRINGIIDMGGYEYACQVPAQPSTITGNANPCETSNQVYSVTNITGVIYTWTVPSGSSITAGQGTNSITVAIGSNSGTISVTPSNSCGDGSARTLAITVNTLAGNAGTITGSTNVCRGTNGVVYTIPVIANASNYNWSVPGGVNIISGENTNSITVDFTSNAISGNISVYGSNGCGNGQSSDLFVTVNYVTVDAGIDNTIPYGTSTTLSGSATNGSGNYTWSWQPANLLINANVQNPQTINLTSSTLFTLTVNDVSTGCSNDDSTIVTISGGPLSVNASASPDQVCDGDSSQLNALAGGGSGNYTYSWTSNPSGFISSLQNPVVYPTITTTYIVVVNDGFNTVSDSVIVNVNYAPTSPDQASGPDTVTTTSIYSTNSVPDADYYLWELIPANAGSLSTDNDTSVTVTWDTSWTGNCSLTVKAVNNCGQSQASTAKNIYVDFLTSVNEVEIVNVNIFPNPCDGRFTITSDKPISAVYLYDVSGRMITNLPDTPSGLYFVHVYMGRESIIRKVIVK